MKKWQVPELVGRMLGESLDEYLTIYTHTHKEGRKEYCIYDIGMEFKWGLPHTHQYSILLVAHQ